MGFPKLELTIEQQLEISKYRIAVQRMSVKDLEAAVVSMVRMNYAQRNALAELVKENMAHEFGQAKGCNGQAADGSN